MEGEDEFRRKTQRMKSFTILSDSGYHSQCALLTLHGSSGCYRSSDSCPGNLLRRVQAGAECYHRLRQRNKVIVVSEGRSSNIVDEFSCL